MSYSLGTLRATSTIPPRGHSRSYDDAVNTFQWSQQIAPTKKPKDPPRFHVHLSDDNTAVLGFFGRSLTPSLSSLLLLLLLPLLLLL